MKAVLISIQPESCELIASGKKTIEVRKTYPKIERPFKCYIYMTATKERCRFWEYITAYQNSKGEILDGSQKVIGEFVCDRIDEIKASNAIQAHYNNSEETCLTDFALQVYAGNKTVYGWRISDLKIYDKPKKISEFRKPCPYGDLPCWSCPSCDKDENDNLIQCFNTVSHPPQSWCYVEE